MSNVKRLLLIVVAAGAAMVSGPASATELNFSYVSDFATLEVTADWVQDSSPVPLAFMDGVSTTVAAAGSDAGLLFGVFPVFTGSFSSVIFNSTLDGGGFSGADFAFDTGSQIYSGFESAPVFGVGVFTLDNGTLTITAVPEPASWAMLLVGFGVIGVASRRRQRLSMTYG